MIINMFCEPKSSFNNNSKLIDKLLSISAHNKTNLIY